MPAKKATAKKATRKTTAASRRTTTTTAVEQPPDETPDAPPADMSIYARMGQILAELPAIGKDRENKEQRFKFRGYDDVLNALNPILSRYGVFVTCRTVERTESTRTTKAGNTLYCVNLHNRYRFYGPDGTFVESDGWGEGTDAGDKATPKAMTGALKYVLFQTFMISTEEASEVDADRHTPEASEPVGTVPCSFCQAELENTTTTKRGHLERVHGWLRNEDGTLRPPDEWVRNEDGTVRPPAKEDPKVEPDEDGPTSADDTDDEDDTADDLAWVDELKGRKLLAEAEKQGVSASGKVAEIRDRIKMAIRNPPPFDTDDETPQDAASDAEDDDGTEDTDDTASDDTGEQDASGEGWACPDCDADGFPTEEAYYEHWSAEHDTDDEPTDDGEITETTLGAVKEAIAGLSGANARAYGKYRREKKLSRPDEMTEGQAMELLAFIDSL